MAYTCTPTPLSDVLVLEPQVFGDNRGFFMESFNQAEFEKATGVTSLFVQDNHSKSSQGVLRGLHFQNPKPQGKLVRVTWGEVFDVAVDIRPQSPTFGQWFGIHLSADNKKQLWLPPGMAHGFLVLSEEAEFLYKTTDYWHPEFEQSILWNDPELNITWPVPKGQDPEKFAPSLAKKDASTLSWSLTRLSLSTPNQLR
jgi:dTDP-4-dehydrorhamnose 3,5-epimerase